MRSQTEQISITINNDEATDIINALSANETQTSLAEKYPDAARLRKLLTNNFVNKMTGVSWID